jgi:hypothetical protein
MEIRLSREAYINLYRKAYFYVISLIYFLIDIPSELK